MLENNGDEIERLRPPRSFAWWFQQPVAAILNARPCVAGPGDLAPEGLRRLLAERPHDRYPVVDAEGRPAGVLTRDEAERAAASGQAPRLHDAETCAKETPIAAVQRQLAESPDQIVAVVDGAGRVCGLLTLHDLLRAQIAAQESGD